MRMRNLATALATSVCLVALATPAQAQERRFDIPAGSLKTALDAYSRQAGQPIIYKPEDVRGARSKGYKGVATARAALDAVLADSGFAPQSGSTGALAIVKTGTPQGNALAGAPNAGSDTASSSGVGTVSESQQGISEILVVGTRTQNVDIRRTENDAQPYVVFGSEEIQKSGASTVEDFLRARLPMNTQDIGPGQLNNRGSQGGINLRGLGVDQTLILVDGRRVAGLGSGPGTSQADITGISPSAIERIEVLPATGSGIYGGSATGGVVNVILKKDYAGIDVRAVYGNTTRFDVPQYRLDVSAGFPLEGGRTRITLFASHSGQGTLDSSERDFTRRSRERLLRNAPTSSTVNTLFSDTPNFCTAASTTACGSGNLVLDNGLSLGSSFGYVPEGYQGPAVTGDLGAALLTNPGRVNPRYGNAVILRSPTTSSLSLNIRREFANWLDFYLDGYIDRVKNQSYDTLAATVFLPASSLQNPFQQDVLARVSFGGNKLESRNILRSTRLTAGGIARLPFHWSALVEYGRSASTYSYSTPNSAVPRASATQILRDLALRDLNGRSIEQDELFDISRVESDNNKGYLDRISLRASGPLVKFPAGNATATILVEGRNETRADHITETGSRLDWAPESSQDVRSGYAEVYLPIISGEMSFPLIRSLEMTAAIRRDHYESAVVGKLFVVPTKDGPFPDVTYVKPEFASTDYTLSAKLSPVNGVVIRGSFGTGFVPPALSQLTPTVGNLPNFLVPIILRLRDPLRNNTIVTGDPTDGLFTLISGGTSNLLPEQSKNLSLGAIFSPSWVNGLRVSVDWTRIKKSDEIRELLQQQIIDLEAELPGRVTRLPLTASDAALGYTGGMITQIDYSAVNVARRNLKFIDFQIDYDLPTQLGDWHFYSVATYTLNSLLKVTPTSPTLEFAGSSPLKWRGNLGIDWKQKRWAAGWNAQYFDGSEICSPTTSQAGCQRIAAEEGGSTHVRAQIYHDLYLKYSFPKNQSNLFLSNLEMNLGVYNVFDKSPPIVASGSVYSQGDLRLRRFVMTLKRHF